MSCTWREGEFAGSAPPTRAVEIKGSIIGEGVSEMGDKNIDELKKHMPREVYADASS